MKLLMKCLKYWMAFRNCEWYLKLVTCIHPWEACQNRPCHRNCLNWQSRNEQIWKTITRFFGHGCVHMWMGWFWNNPSACDFQAYCFKVWCLNQISELMPNNFIARATKQDIVGWKHDILVSYSILKFISQIHAYIYLFILGWSAQVCKLNSKGLVSLLYYANSAFSLISSYMPVKVTSNQPKDSPYICSHIHRAWQTIGNEDGWGWNFFHSSKWGWIRMNNPRPIH